MRRPDDPAIAPLTTRRPAAHADPRLVHGGVAQGVRLLRRLQRTQGNAAVVRTLAARRRTASSAATGPVATLVPPHSTSGSTGPEVVNVQAALVDIPPPPTKAPVEPPEDDPRFAK